MRFLTAGESHGPVQLAIVEGFPAGVPVTPEPIDRELGRRQGGYGRGQRMKIEQDRVSFLSGVRNGLSTGAPIAMQVTNRDYANWTLAMDPSPVEPGDTERLAAIDAKRITKVRPGHADYAGARKYRLEDVRDVLERSSARETTSRVMAGALAGVLLGEFGIRVASHVVEIGPLKADTSLPAYESFDRLQEAAEASAVRCADPAASERMIALINETRTAGDTLGGIVEIIAEGLPVGLGTYAQWDRRLDGLLAQAVMSIHAIKGVEVGLGFEAARRPGSQVHDPFYPGFRRETNRAGGLEGGMTNGQPLILRAAMKPIPTLIHPLPSVHLDTGEAVSAHFERSDVCAVPAAGVVAEAMVRWVLATVLLDKVGGDSLSEMRDHYRTLYQEASADA
ncbi:MAG TPA: chorismate synthase [Stenomitos sp.]